MEAARRVWRFGSPQISLAHATLDAEPSKEGGSSPEIHRVAASNSGDSVPNLLTVPLIAVFGIDVGEFTTHRFDYLHGLFPLADSRELFLARADVEPPQH